MSEAVLIVFLAQVFIVRQKVCVKCLACVVCVGVCRVTADVKRLQLLIQVGSLFNHPNKVVNKLNKLRPKLFIGKSYIFAWSENIRNHRQHPQGKQSFIS